jgi:glyoxylase-like metal-dependent hydrolase (beta-lactamase superfamily II)
VLQVRRTGKGCLSYLIGSNGSAAVIDAAVDPEAYVQLAAQRGWKIESVLDTHVHADHLSGGPALAGRLGGDYFVGAGAGFNLRHPIRALSDGDELRVGNIAICVLATPGHTPGSVCFAIEDRDAGRIVFAGDTLFRRSVGRTDLPGGDTGTLHRSIRERLYTRNPGAVVVPGHGPSTTLGEELKGNPYVRP